MRPVIQKTEFKDRVIRTQRIMEEKDIDIMLAFGNEMEPQFQRYYSDYWPSFESAAVVFAKTGDAVLLIGPESMTFAKDRSVLPNIKRMATFRESSNPEYPGHRMETFKQVINELVGEKHVNKIAIAGIGLMPHRVYCEITDALPRNTMVVSGDDVVMSLRMVKSEAEIECMRYCAKITHETMLYIIDNINSNMTELQVRALAYYKMFELGAEDVGYPAWFLSGAGGNQAISRPRHKKIERDTITHLQAGTRYEGYVTTIGRPIVLGKPKQWMLNAINAAYEGYAAIEKQLYEGNNAKEVARFFYETMKKNGHENWLLYGPCHATGLMEGEPPWIESGADFKLQKNMTFCICLFMGDKNGCGFRIEDSFLVGKRKAENLTNFARELFIIDK